MASKQVRTPPTKITSNYVTPDDQMLDMGAYRVCGIQCTRLKTQASTSPVKVQHNCTKDPTGWLDTTAAFKLDGTDPDFQEVTSFGRYFRLVGPVAADGTAVFMVDWIGKE